MHTNHITSALLASVLMLSIVGLTTTSVIAQPFDITTEQGEQEALITVKLATNNTVVIPPNGTVIEVPGNITQIDNDTVVIAPDNETVTETPGNVTVIDPPAPEPCACPPAVEEPSQNETEGIDPVRVTPAPGQEVTIENATVVTTNETGIVVEGTDNETGVAPEPEPFPEPATNETGGNGGGNEAGDGGEGSNETAGGGNETGVAPAAFSQIFTWMNSA